MIRQHCSDYTFGGDVIGKASINTMCSWQYSNGVNIVSNTSGNFLRYATAVVSVLKYEVREQYLTFTFDDVTGSSRASGAGGDDGGARNGPQLRAEPRHHRMSLSRVALHHES